MNNNSSHSPGREGDALNHHLEEHMIETFVRHPESLDTEERQMVAAHLERCPACRSIAEYLRNFHEALEGAGEKPPPGLDDFVAKLFPSAHLVPLFPYRAEPAPGYVSEVDAVVLAAKSPGPESARFELVATLASAQQDTLLRILRDRQGNALRFYILAEDQRKYAHAIISMPALDIEVVADENGRGALEEGGKPISDWADLKCLLRLPVGEARIEGKQLRAASQHDPFVTKIEDRQIKIVYERESLTFEVQPDQSGAQSGSLAVLGGPASDLLLVTLQDGKGSHRLSALPPSGLMIRLYS